MTFTLEQKNKNAKKRKGNRPTHVVKVRRDNGEKTYFEKVGAGWLNEDGSFYVKFVGDQVISSFTMWPADDRAKVLDKT